MEVTEDLVKKFFENRCIPTEVDLLIAYFHNNPEAIEQYLGFKEWKELEANQDLSVDLSKEMEAYIRAKIFSRKPVGNFRKRIPVKWFSVAASLLLFFAAALWLFSRKNAAAVNFHSLSGKENKGVQNNGTPRTNWIKRVNETGKTVKMMLWDSSVVELFNHSSLKYQEPFEENKRDIYLSGEASFRVTKDIKRPFTVYSGSLSTTALGTSFRVIAFKGSKKDISVKLFTGRVVIRSVENLAGWKKDIYLLPGEEMVYNSSQKLAKVNRPELSTEKPDYFVRTEELVFVNRPLKEVLDKISQVYKVKIQYNEADLEGLSFTGSLSASDSLAVFLKLVVRMNGLSITEGPDVYMILKSNQ